MTIYDYRDSNNANDKINNTSSTSDTDKDNIIKLPLPSYIAKTYQV